MTDDPTPSAPARELVRGGFDLHVHVGPDVVRRRIDDVGLARRHVELGLEGFVLKSHYGSTAERAAVVRGVVPDVRAMGALVLNNAVGGMNPLAVDIAGREGARIVWMPTVDAPNETAGRRAPKPGEKVPVWAALQHELREQGIDIDPVQTVDADGQVLPAVRSVLATVARYQMVLATGHIATAETFAVVDAALEAGIRDVVVTHPDFPAQDISLENQVALAERGAWIERCFTTPHTAKCTWERWLDGIRAVGPAHTILSSDLGQVFNPPVEDGLALMADRLLDAGFSDANVRTMAVENTRKVAGPA